MTTGQTWAWWRDQLATRPSLPFAPDEVLLVAFNGFGDMVVWQAAGWPVVRFVDLALELTRLQNVDRAKGTTPHWWSLREALAHYGLPVPESRHKREMQELCARGGPEVEAHRDAILAVLPGGRRPHGGAVARDGGRDPRAAATPAGDLPRVRVQAEADVVPPRDPLGRGAVSRARAALGTHEGRARDGDQPRLRRLHAQAHVQPRGLQRLARGPRIAWPTTKTGPDERQAQASGRTWPAPSRR